MEGAVGTAGSVAPASSVVASTTTVGLEAGAASATDVPSGSVLGGTSPVGIRVETSRPLVAQGAAPPPSDASAPLEPSGLPGELWPDCVALWASP